MEEQCQQKSSIFFVFSLFFFCSIEEVSFPSLTLTHSLSLVFSLHVTASFPSCSEKHTQWCIYNIVFSTTTF